MLTINILFLEVFERKRFLLTYNLNYSNDKSFNKTLFLLWIFMHL